MTLVIKPITLVERPLLLLSGDQIYADDVAHSLLFMLILRAYDLLRIERSRCFEIPAATTLSRSRSCTRATSFS